MKTIGDTNRDGTLEIMDTRWDYNGALRVTIRDNMGIGEREFPARQARTLARAAIAHPHLTKRTYSAYVFYDYGCQYVTYVVSRLP